MISSQTPSGRYAICFEIFPIIHSINILLPMNKQNHRPATTRPQQNRHPSPNSNPSTLAPSSSFRGASHEECLRFIIASNADYFRGKLRGKETRSGKELKLKIPCRTGCTTYRKDYLKKKTPQHCHAPASILAQTQPIDLTVSATTNYQQDYQKHNISRTQSCRRLKKRQEEAMDDEGVPRFLETQNRMDFLNWGGKNCVASMRPPEKSAVTNLPFEATSVYRMEFEGKVVPPTPSFARQSSFPRFGLVPAVMRTNYNSEFCSKRGQMQTSCKPKHADATLCKQFKGTTEYKRQFQRETAGNQPEGREWALDELQTLIIDL